MPEIVEIIADVDADLIFLTETNSTVELPNYHRASTVDLPKLYYGIDFSPNENKVSIYSKTKLSQKQKTYDEFSSVCEETVSEIGKLSLYGSIIGFTGGRNEHFTNDLKMQMFDLQKLAANNDLCFSGDLNISFSGHPYPSKAVQAEMLEFCDSLNLEIITRDIADTVLHIVLSKELLKGKSVKVIEKFIENRLSDHHPVLAEIF